MGLREVWCDYRDIHCQSEGPYSLVNPVVLRPGFTLHHPKSFLKNTNFQATPPEILSLILKAPLMILMYKHS